MLKRKIDWTLDGPVDERGTVFEDVLVTVDLLAMRWDKLHSAKDGLLPAVYDLAAISNEHMTFLYFVFPWVEWSLGHPRHIFDWWSIGEEALWCAADRLFESKTFLALMLFLRQCTSIVTVSMSNTSGSFQNPTLCCAVSLSYAVFSPKPSMLV
ncbi:hypothetical protein MRB53_037615 [Persea americana]|nr:hypothetical protein MRB53_037615 [Persea americana]